MVRILHGLGIYHLKVLVLSSVDEDADESMEPAAHLETKCVTVALDSC